MLHETVIGDQLDCDQCADEHRQSQTASSIDTSAREMIDMMVPKPDWGFSAVGPLRRKIF